MIRKQGKVLQCASCGRTLLASGNQTVCRRCDAALRHERPKATVPRKVAGDRRDQCLACTHFGTHNRGGETYEGCGLLAKPCRVELLRLDPTWLGPPGKVCFRPNIMDNLVADLSATDHYPTLAAPYISREQLARDVLLVARKLALQQPSAILGVPRSGMIPASMLATMLNLPLYSLDQGGEVIRLRDGIRFRTAAHLSGPMAVVEDSVASGHSFRELDQILPPNGRYLKAAVYTTPSRQTMLDAFGRVLPLPHWFEWNLWGQSALLDAFKVSADLDGLICENCPIDDDDDGPRYRTWMDGVQPLVFPNFSPLRAVITARLERYREATVAWLARYRIQYSDLIMGPWQSPAERTLQAVAQWKADAVRSIGSAVYVESEPDLAIEISRRTDAAVICPAAGTAFYRGQGPSLR